MPDSEPVKNVISLRDYYPQLRFGFAAARTGLPPSRLFECADLKYFEAIELHREQYDAIPHAERAAFQQRFKIIQAGSILESPLAYNILNAPESMQTDFVRTVEAALRGLAGAGIECATVHFSVASALEDPVRRKSLGRILHQLAPVLQETSRVLLLPVRVPSQKEDGISVISAFLREMMIPNLKVRLDLYPHEMSRDFDPVCLAGTLRLETRSVLFCYNADCGNRLVRAHLMPWLRYFSLISFTGPFLVCPFSRDNRLAAIEGEAFSKLAGEIKTLHE